jgi:hypothetical protein
MAGGFPGVRHLPCVYRRTSSANNFHYSLHTVSCIYKKSLFAAALMVRTLKADSPWHHVLVKLSFVKHTTIMTPIHGTTHTATRQTYKHNKKNNQKITTKKQKI